MLNSELNSEGKLLKLKEWFKEQGKVAVAFSGGVDSTFLLKVAHDTLGDDCIAVTITSDVFPLSEFNEAMFFLKEEKINFHLVDVDIMSLPEFVDNGRERCYYCKKFLFGKVMDIAEKNGFVVIADGTNVDDANLIRPGIKALHELGIRSPLFDLAFTKKDIRDLSRKLGLSSFRKQSMSCLATRFPYDLRIDKEKLSRISACEEYLYSSGLRTYRVRLGGMNGEIARIEVMPEDINNVVDNREDIISFFREKGFKYVTVDLEGFRSGSMDI